MRLVTHKWRGFSLGAGAVLALALHVPAAPAQTLSQATSSSREAPPALPSGDAAIRVVVADQTGAVIPSAVVEITSPSGATLTGLTGPTGELLITNLAPGRYAIRASFEGFEPVELPDVRVRGRETRRELRLPIARVADQVTVARDPRESSTDPRGDAFSTVLTQDQIDQLPDDPDELEEALRQMAGPDAVMRVNGFRGGRLPPKSQIREIRFRRNMFAADSHEWQVVGIDIRTRPGGDTFRGSLDLAVRDESLNARNAFAPYKGPEQQRRFSVSMEGPIVKDRTSFALATDGFDAFDSKTIIAALVGGAFNDVVQRPIERLNVNVRLEHALTRSHALRAELQRGSMENQNLGVGDFDLPDRAYTREVETRLFRLSESGPIGRRMFNELRFQVSWQDTALTPLTEAPGVQVLNAFASGGAQLAGERRTRTIEVADNLDINGGRHAMRAGFLLEGGRYRSNETRNANGVFTFSSLEAFAAGRPTTYTQRTGNPLVEFSQYQFGWYVQDDIRARKDLTVSLGLRHEFQSNLHDWLNLAPRGGLLWSPFRSGSTTIRAGAGIFYNWYEAETHEQTLRVDGVSQQDLVVRNPGFPDPFAGATATVLPPGRIVADPDMRMPTVFQSSLGIERRLTQTSTLNVMYLDTRGSSELRGRNINAPVPGVGRPDPSAGNITQIESSARSLRRATVFNLSMSVPARRIFAAINYTLGWTRNDADGPLSLPADNYDLAAEWGAAPSDVRHRLSGMFNVPLWRELRVSSMFRAQSAAPYNITTGFDDNGDTVSNDRPAGVGRNSARGESQWEVSARLAYSFGFGERREPATPPTTIVRVRSGDDAPTGGFMGAGAANKRVRLDLYLGASNLFNVVNRVNFSGVQTSPFFGQPTAAMPGRRLELGVRIGF
jgi:hypothetical protein